MSERTGLDPLEEAILLTLADLGAQNNAPHMKSARLLTAVERRYGYGSRHTYAMLCDLVCPSTVQIPLVDSHGHFGTPDFAANGARYNECRLSRAGHIAVAAERSEIPPLPIVLINGTFYKGGLRPPFELNSVTAGLIRLLADEDVTDADLIDIVGPPAIPTGCDVSGEIDKLIDGRPATLKLTAVVREASHGGAAVLDISQLPPGMSSSQVADNIEARIHLDVESDELTAAAAIDLRDVIDMSTPDQTMIRCVLTSDADPCPTADRLRGIWGVTIEIAAQLPAPLPKLFRRWVHDHATDATADALAQLQAVAFPE